MLRPIFKSNPAQYMATASGAGRLYGWTGGGGGGVTGRVWVTASQNTAKASDKTAIGTPARA